MFTRKDYLDGKVTHRQYYGQFVTEAVKTHVGERIGEDKIKLSQDEHMNDIPLSLWFMWTPTIQTLCSRAVCKVDPCGLCAWTFVCIMKEAARQIKQES
jgi:hypothetical protein